MGWIPPPPPGDEEAFWRWLKMQNRMATFQLITIGIGLILMLGMVIIIGGRKLGLW